MYIAERKNSLVNIAPFLSLGNSQSGRRTARINTRHVKRILAFGDSLTEGYYAGGQKFYPYTTQLEAKLNAAFNYTRFEVLNEGVSGKCAFKDLVKKLPKVLGREKKRVDLVIILGGCDDFRKLRCNRRRNIVDDIIALHKMVHKAGLKSVVVTIPECVELDKKSENARILANKKLRVFARQNQDKTLLCDLSEGLPMKHLYDFDRKVYWDDTVHPSKIGYDKIADLLFQLVKPKFEEVVPKSKDSTAEKNENIYKSLDWNLDESFKF